MAILHQYDYIFALGTIFAFLDAWNIGANDVANSWATSVASRSLSYIQAMCLASVMEFVGAVGAGARVTDTIRTKIVDPELFAEAPEVLMLGMLCAVIASSIFLTCATKIGFPVSTTHSILGGVLGMGIAAVGADNITWTSYDSDGKFKLKGGVVAVFLAWIIAPCLSAVFASFIFLVTKFAVLLRKNPIMMAFFSIPIYFGITAALLCMLIVTKGGQIKSDLNDAEIAGVILGVGASWAILITIFLLPWIYRRVIKDDWPLRWYHIPMGPLLLRRGEVPPPPANHDGIRNFYEGHLTREELEARRTGAATRGDVEAAAGESKGSKDVKGSSDSDVAVFDGAPKKKSLIGPKPEGKTFSGPVLFWYLKFAIFRGVEMDVVAMQGEKSVLSGDLEDTHARASHFDNKVEYMFAFLQVMTAATASFTHGANDVANAIGPYATIFQVWNSGSLDLTEAKSGVPTWILAFGGVAIAIGLWTYGYHIMRNLGNRLTLQSPARGFAIELGAAITIILATRLKLPISTTQCITGATVGVGLCNGDWRAINWRMVSWIYVGWIITLPCAGVISGALMGFVINAPHWTA